MSNIQTNHTPTTLMHKVMHHFGDWELDTAHMTRTEKSIYFDMRTLYLKEGRPLTDNLPLLERLLCCHNDEEKTALAFLLSHKFRHDKKRQAYRHSDWDTQIKNYKFAHYSDNTNIVGNASNAGNEKITAGNGTGNAKSNAKPLSNAERQRRYKQRQKMLKTLINKGITVPLKATFDTILCLFNKVVGNASNAGNDKNNAKNNAITNNQEPITNKLATNETNFEKIDETTPKRPSTVKIPTTPDPTFVFSQRQKDICTAKGMNIDEAFAKFRLFYTSRNFNCTEQTWIAMFDNWLTKERLPSALNAKTKADTGSVTPTGESYKDYIAKIMAENRAFAIKHGMVN
ncbi:DUF1376 domain-containing protein [Moraxella sp. Pampa]|uniref:DUF1376 domain-containing protein n=1 Tax=Moraxella sp. Pampa TaxID=3111978 RepID=UPI002B417D21|nr:DUF1376 domain-containing protein [Moraxella sp. Pampa]